MILGVNNGINLDTKKAGLVLMDGGPSRINPPNSHPSNLIHKAAMAAQNPKPDKAKTPDLQQKTQLPSEEAFSEKTPQHEMNKTAVIVCVVGVIALIFIATR